jgi:hypothetical protein
VSTVTMFVSKSTEIEDLSRAAAGEPVRAFVGAESKRAFIWCSYPKWDEAQSEEKTVIELHWRLTSSQWLPQRPVRCYTTVGELNLMRQLAKAPAF